MPDVKPAWRANGQRITTLYNLNQQAIQSNRVSTTNTPPHANRRDHKGIWRLYLKGHEARMRGIPLGLLALPYLVAQPVFPEVHVWLTLEAVTSTHVGHEQVVVGIDIHMADQFAF